MAKELVSSSSSRKKVYDIIQAFKTETVARSITPLRDGNLLEMILAMTKEEVDMLENLLSLHAQSSIGTIHIDDLNRDLTDNFTVYQAGLLPCFKIVFGSAEHGDFEKVVGFLKTFTFGANITQILQCSYVKDSQNPSALRPGNAIFSFIRTYTPSATNGGGADLLAWKEYRQENATVSSDGWMSKEDKKKLDNLQLTRYVHINFNNLVPVMGENPMSMQIDGEYASAADIYNLLRFTDDGVEIYLRFRDSGGTPHFLVYNRADQLKSCTLYGLVKPTSADYRLELGIEVTNEKVSVISVSQFYLTNASQAHDGFMSKEDKKKLDAFTDTSSGSGVAIKTVNLYIENNVPKEGDEVSLFSEDGNSIEEFYQALREDPYQSLQLSLRFPEKEILGQVLSVQPVGSPLEFLVATRVFFKPGEYEEAYYLELVLQVGETAISVYAVRKIVLNPGEVHTVLLSFSKENPEANDSVLLLQQSVSDLYDLIDRDQPVIFDLRVRFGAGKPWIRTSVMTIQPDTNTDSIFIYYMMATKIYMISIDGSGTRKSISFRGLVTDLAQAVNSVPTDIVKQWFKDTEH